METLKNTGATANVVSATVVTPFKELTGKNECELTKIVGRGLKDVDYSDDDVTGAVVEMTIKIIEENPDMRDEACAAMEGIMKDFGGFPDQIRQFMKEVLPPPPTPPTPPMDPAIAAELERLHQEELARAAKKLAMDQDDEDDFEGVPRNKTGQNEDECSDPKKKPGLKTMDSLKLDSRRGSMEGGSGSRRGSILLGGGERRGSFYDEGVTTRASVAVITDDPEQKKKLKKDLDGVFNEGGATMGNGVDALSSLVGSLPPNVSPEVIKEMLENSLEGTGLSKDEADKLLAVFATDAGGTGLAGLGQGLGIHTVSDESRALMQQILSSTSSQEEISSRVTALLAGTALSTSRGEKPRGGGYGEVKMAEYNVPTTDLSASIPRRRPEDNVQGYLDPNDSTAFNNSTISSSLGGQGSTVGGLGNTVGSLSGGAALPSRQSVLLQSRERRRRREEETEKANSESTKASYYRKVIGLRRAKVPLMVYSCGGFSRCFRIARFYDVEGPPVGVTYDRDSESRAALNPDL